MTPETACPKSGDYHYYRCTDNLSCKNRVRAEHLEQAVIEHVIKTRISKAEYTAIAEEIEKRRQDAIKQNRPEVDRTELALKEVKAEREQIFEMLIASPRSEQIRSMANEKIDSLSVEIETLLARLEVLKKQAAAGLDSYDIARDIATQINSMSELLAQPHENGYPDDLRRAILIIIDKIEALDTGDFVIHPSFSSKSKKWLPFIDFIELVYLKFSLVS
jgi:arsenate reductase-like glutaredoxin family protein